MLPRATVALVLLLAHASPGAAQDRPLGEAVSIANGDECVVAAPLVAAAAEWLGRPDVDARLAILIDLAPDGRSAAVIAIRDGAEVAVRRFDPLPGPCADRRTVLSLGVALAIDALLLDGIEARPAAVAPAPPPTDSIGVDLAGEGGLAIGTLEGLAGLGAATLGVALPPLVRLRLGVVASSVASFALGAGAVDVSLVAGRVDGCLVATVGPLELDGCVGALAGGALANGRDYAMTRASTQPWIAVAPRLEAAVWLAEPLALTLAADGLFALATPRFDVTDGDGALLFSHTLPVASLAASVGLRVRFR